MSSSTFKNKPSKIEKTTDNEQYVFKSWRSHPVQPEKNGWDICFENSIQSLKVKPIKHGIYHLYDYDNLTLVLHNPMLIVKTFEGEFLVDNKLNLIVDAIKSSTELLKLADDWDGEDAIGCNPLILDYAVNILLKYSQNVLKYHDVIIYAPEINLAKDGSIDLEWRCENRILLINILNEENFKAEYYGNDFKSKTIIKGILDSYVINRTLSFWMQNLL